MRIALLGMYTLLAVAAFDLGSTDAFQFGSRIIGDSSLGRWHGSREAQGRMQRFRSILDTRKSVTEDGDESWQSSKKVEVGSKEYLEGFISSPIQDDTVSERGSGLEQALKLGGGVALVLIALIFGFLASNGLV
jgi:hypothetical protein